MEYPTCHLWKRKISDSCDILWDTTQSTASLEEAGWAKWFRALNFNALTRVQIQESGHKLGCSGVSALVSTPPSCLSNSQLVCLQSVGILIMLCLFGIFKWSACKLLSLTSTATFPSWNQGQKQVASATGDWCSRKMLHGTQCVVRFSESF